MSALVLLTAPDCHLCEHGKGVLDELGVDWREVDATSDDGRLVAYGRLSLKRLRKQLGYAHGRERVGTPVVRAEARN